jgi:hypothetical protein
VEVIYLIGIALGLACALCETIQEHAERAGHARHAEPTGRVP